MSLEELETLFSSDSDISGLAASATTDTTNASNITSGTLSNARTTATSSNIPSTIVARDVTGSFSGILVGSASNNVLKSGDTMTGALVIPSGTPSLPSLSFTGSLNTGLSATSNILSFSTNGNQVISINAVGIVQINGLNALGIVHTDSNGNLSTSLLIDGDISPGASISDTKIATITTSGKVANSATSATSTSTSSSIVSRDINGSFSANIITATLNGNASSATNAVTSTNFSGNLSGDVSGTQSANVVNTIGGTSASNIANAVSTVLSATSTNVPSTLVIRDGSGNATFNNLFATLMGTATNNVLKNGDTMTGTLQIPAGTTSLPSLCFTGSTTTGLSVSSNILSLITNGNQRLNISASGTVQINNLNSVGIAHTDGNGNLSTSLIVNSDISASAAIVDSKFATITSAGKVANSATSATSTNTTSAIVARDSSGNFSAGTITASLNGNASTATSATTASSATTAITAANFSGSLSGDVSGTQGATVVNTVGGATASNVSAVTAMVLAATNNDTGSTLVARDGSGKFSTNMITIDGTTTNPTDVATKSYVDAATTTGIVPIEPAIVVSTVQTTLSGLQTIDSVLLVDSDRVLLVNQTSSIQNGVWLAHSGSWTSQRTSPLETPLEEHTSSSLKV